MTGNSPISGQELSLDIDTSVAHSARCWDYLLGGKDNYPVDREACERAFVVRPGLVDTARVDRGFLIRSVRYLAGEVEVRQFLDIGTGLPTANNTHQVAQGIPPECRIVYVDEACPVVNRLLDALSAGSHLALSHPTAEVGEGVEESMRNWNESGAAPMRTRTIREITQFFDCLELAEPGVVSCSLWRPEPYELDAPLEVDQFCGVGRKSYAAQGIRRHS